MGTNFYMITKNKDLVDEYAPYSYELTDYPYFGYKIHVAKTSAGWLPLFQEHNKIKSVKDYKELYDHAGVDIYDEYGTSYDWIAFKVRVLNHNGGIEGAQPREYIEVDKNNIFYDSDMPNYTPISHFNYVNGKYTNYYFKDDQGYEFSKTDFS